MNILFMCEANSGQSQLAKEIGREIFGDVARIESACLESYEQLSTHFLDNLDYVITLSDDEVYPALTTTETKKLHWPLKDRDQLQNRIKQFASETRKSIPDVTVAETSAV